MADGRMLFGGSKGILVVAPERLDASAHQPLLLISELSDAGLVFFLFDLDHFKYLNDRHGHAAGDAVLTQMSGRLSGVFRDTDDLVRWGGEEFLVVARATPRTHAAELAERARVAVAD